MIRSLVVERREFLKRASGLVLSSLASAGALGAADAGPANPVGYAIISWPKDAIDHALQTISHLEFKGVQLLGWVRSAYGDGKEERLRNELNGLHLQPAALSCSGVSLNPARLSDVTTGVRDYATFFKELHGKYLQVTDGGRPRLTYSADEVVALGKQMNELGKVAQDTGLTLGYHPHIGTLGETREGLGRVLDATDPRYVKLIADVGHLTLGGSDPAEVIRTYRERLIFCHFKDVRKDTAEAFKKDPTAWRPTKYKFCEVGEGVVDFPAVVRAFRDTRFEGWVIVELDAYEPRPGGPDESARINKTAIQRLGFQF